jgi:hypothetical protein
VIPNPRRREECPPLVLVRNPRRQATSTRVDGGRIASLRERLIGLAGRELRGVQTAPRLDLETAAEVLGISVDEVRDLARRRRICETWEVQPDGRREQVVRAIDLIAMLSRGAPPIRVLAR